MCLLSNFRFIRQVLDGKNKEESIESGEYMKKQRLGMHQRTRTRTRRVCAKVVSPIDAHAYMPRLHGLRSCQSTRARTGRARAPGAHAPILSHGPLEGKMLGVISELPRPKSNSFLKVFHTELKIEQTGEHLVVA